MMIFEMTKNDFFLTMAGVLMVLGVLILLVGVIILVTRVLGGDVKKIANQTAQMAQKGITEEIAGLVGNASSLVDSLNELMKTAAGVGVFMVFLGLLLLAAAYGLTTQIQ